MAPTLWMINPKSGRKIKVGGPTYMRLKIEGGYDLKVAPPGMDRRYALSYSDLADELRERKKMARERKLDSALRNAYRRKR